MSRMHGQAEMALVLGLVAVAVIVILYAYSTFTYPVPGGTTSEQKGAEAYVRDAIRSSAEAALMKIYSQGGYYDIADAPKTVKFAGSDTAYWQICNDVQEPDIKEQVEKGVKGQIRSRLPDSTNLGGRQVTFSLSPDNFHVTAMIHDNKVSLEVNLPTTVDGVGIPQPYRLEIDSRLGRIYNFARDFANFEKRYRVLDYGLMQHINISNPNEEGEGACWLPTMGMTVTPLRRSWSRTEECMERQITHTLSHTYEWQKPWLNDNGDLPSDLLENLYIFQIQKSDGSWGQYADLGMEFYYGGDGRKLTKTDGEFYLRTDPEPIDIKPVGIPGVMRIGSYDIKYDVSFPVVITVMDELLKKNFNFAVFVNIRNSAPSNEHCMESAPLSPAETACINDVSGKMNLTVTDTSGSPLPGVHMSFGQCPFDAPSNGDGKFSFAIPNLEGDQVITLYDDATQTEYNVTATTQELEDGMTVAMPLNRQYTIHIYSVVLNPDDQNRIGICPEYPPKIYLNFITKPDDSAMEQVVYSVNNVYKDMREINPNELDPDNPEMSQLLADPPRSDIKVTLPAEAIYTVNITIEANDGTRQQLQVDDFEMRTDKSDIYIFAPYTSDGAIAEQVANVWRNYRKVIDFKDYVFGGSGMDTVTEIQHSDSMGWSGW